MIKFMEKIKLKNNDEIKIPDAVMIRPKLVAVFDNIKDTINIMTSIYPNKKTKAQDAYNNANLYLEKTIKKLSKDIKLNVISSKKNLNDIQFKSNYSKKEYFQIIKKAKLYIKKGDIFQVVPSQRFKTKYDSEIIIL